jgi:hypothetical protein
MQLNHHLDIIYFLKMKLITNVFKNNKLLKLLKLLKIEDDTPAENRNYRCTSKKIYFIYIKKIGLE